MYVHLKNADLYNKFFNYFKWKLEFYNHKVEIPCFCDFLPAPPFLQKKILIYFSIYLSFYLLPLKKLTSWHLT